VNICSDRDQTSAFQSIQRLKMKLKLINFTLMFMIMTNNGQYALGSGGYQAPQQSSKRFDNGNNSPSSPANYKFEYGVDDGSGGPQFGHEEERNGHQTRGMYRVLLPDGRTQVVTYTADENGYKADVTYENGPSSSNSGAYSSGGDNGGAGGGYENVRTAASSYGPPPAQAAETNTRGYSSKGFNGRSNSFNGNRNSRSFVKLRRTVDGRMFNYAY